MASTEETLLPPDASAPWYIAHVHLPIGLPERLAKAAGAPSGLRITFGPGGGGTLHLGDEVFNFTSLNEANVDYVRSESDGDATSREVLRVLGPVRE